MEKSSYGLSTIVSTCVNKASAHLELVQTLIEELIENSAPESNPDLPSSTSMAFCNSKSSKSETDKKEILTLTYLSICIEDTAERKEYHLKSKTPQSALTVSGVGFSAPSGLSHLHFLFPTRNSVTGFIH